MGGIFLRLKQWWAEAAQTQKLITIGGLSMLFLLVVATFMLASRQEYKVLFPGMELDEQTNAEIITSLDSLQIEYRESSPGRIEVPADKVNSIKAKLAQAGKLPTRNRSLGLANLSDSHLGETREVQTQRLNAIREGELARTIELLVGVRSARVTITEPPDTVFTDTKSPPSVSIMVFQDDSGSNANLGQAIAALAKESVAGLDPKNIQVVNQNSQFLFNGEEQEGGSEGTLLQMKINDAESKKRQRALQTSLDTAFGPNNTIVIVHADVNIDQVSQDETARKLSDQPIRDGSRTEQYQNGQPIEPDRASGTVAKASAPATANDSGKTAAYKQEDIQKEFVVTSEKTTKTTHQGGTLRSLTINVLVDETTVPDEKKVESFVKNEIAALGDKGFVAAVVKAPFNREVQQTNVKQQSEYASQQRMQQIISLLPVAAMLIVAFMVIKQVGKVAKAYAPEPVLTASTMSALPTGDFASNQALEAASNNILAMLASGNAEDGSILTSEDGEAGLSVEEIKDRVHLPLEQLKKMANEKPGVVGMLIKSMLLEDRR